MLLSFGPVPIDIVYNTLLLKVHPLEHGLTLFVVLVTMECLWYINTRCVFGLFMLTSAYVLSKYRLFNFSFCWIILGTAEDGLLTYSLRRITRKTATFTSRST